VPAPSSAVDVDHLIATFPDLATGYAAMSAKALEKYDAGMTSLNQLIAHNPGGWTPGALGPSAAAGRRRRFIEGERLLNTAGPELFRPRRSLDRARLFLGGLDGAWLSCGLSGMGGGEALADPAELLAQDVQHVPCRDTELCGERGG